MPHSTISTPPTASPLKTAFDRDGFVILSSSFPPSTLSALRTACDKATALARAGQWPYIRTLPRQFPPWKAEDYGKGIWGVQHLMHPDLPGHELFTEVYFCEAILGTVRELLGGCAEEMLVMELWNLLVRPEREFELRWHRDDIPATATPSEELTRLSKPSFHAQWNFCLYDDESLIVVPGSHSRARTPIEREADPYEPNLPGQQIVRLKAGEMVFYNNNLLHRGVYRSDVERMTLHGSMGHVEGGSLRARNVLQHGREWIERIDLGGVEDRARAEGMRRRLVELGSRYEDVGFAHDE